MFKSFLITFIILCLSGCSAVGHVDELLTLKGLSQERDATDKDIETYDKKMDQLFEAYQKGELKAYTSKRKLKSAYGQPIFARWIERNGNTAEEWLYRYMTRYTDSDKLYFYFDKKGYLVETVFERKLDKANEIPSSKKENP